MSIESVKVPFGKMTFSPDVPSAALGANEYNVGRNIETDIRGIRSVAGDQEILASVPGTPTYVTGGFRADGRFYFVVGTDEGHWWAGNDQISWTDITPPSGVGTYTQASPIMSVWNGNVLFINDAQNPPMFWPDNVPGSEVPVLVMYSNQQPVNINSISVTDTTSRTITFDDTTPPRTQPPFPVGSYINVSGVNPRYYDGVFYVTSATTTSVTYTDSTIGPYTDSGTVAAQFTWNYNPNWSQVTAGFLRMYNTPNVGSILVAGNLTATPVTTSTTEVYPVTIQWSQNFGLNQAPTSWTPTVINIANQLEVPLRGPAVDAFPTNQQFFICSYWDTVVFSPLNYQTTSAPILGVSLFTQGRGLFSSNCWAKTDTMVFGVDARDIWAFDGQQFTGIGNQRVKNWFYDQLNPNFFDRIYMVSNTQKNQIELYYPDRSSLTGVPNKMISYRYDLDCWNPPRDVTNATMACEAPLYVNNQAQFSHRTIVYARGDSNEKLVQKDQGFSFVSTNTSTVAAISSVFRRDNIKILSNYNSKLIVHRVLPEVNNLGTIIDQGNDLPVYDSTATINVTIEGANSVGSTATQVNSVTLFVDANGNNQQDPWAQFDQNAFRVNTIQIDNTSTSNVWYCSASTWQVTQVEDDR